MEQTVEKKETIEKTARDFEHLNEDSKNFILGYMVGIQYGKLVEPADK